MWVFWIVTGLLAAASAALVMARAGASARRAAGGLSDPAAPVYRRQLAELDEAAAHGLLQPEEHRAARAEAGRRLLRTAEASAPAERTGGRASRLAAACCAGLAAALALGVYLRVGQPGMGDEPYAKRLASWRRADPSTLDAARLAAVLADVARSQPHDPRVWSFLGRAEMAAGDPFDAGQAFARAATLAPRRPDLYAAEGQALVQDAQGKVTPQALAVFQAALRLDPREPTARYYLALAQVAAGDRAAGLAAWRALADDLAPGDPRRPALRVQIARLQAADIPGGDAAPSAQARPRAEAGAGQPTALARFGPQAAFIQAMVARQASELQSRPDDPAGWARLVRAYGVLGDAAAQQRALAQARRVFAGRPDVMASIETQARMPPPPPG